MVDVTYVKEDTMGCLVGRSPRLMVDAGDNRKTMDQLQGVRVSWTNRRFRRRFAKIGTIFDDKTRNAPFGTVGRRYRITARRVSYVVTTIHIRTESVGRLLMVAQARVRSREGRLVSGLARTAGQE